MNCASEEYVEKEIIFAAIDDDNNGGFFPGVINSSDNSEEENDVEIENNFSVAFMWQALILKNMFAETVIRF